MLRKIVILMFYFTRSTAEHGVYTHARTLTRTRMGEI